MTLREPQHINANKDSLAGNQGLGRYIFLTGSDSRAQQISERFNQTHVLKHPRQHNLYLGTIPGDEEPIDVAAISTGMGGSSADIIINELIMLGAQRFLRVGTAGSLQPERIVVGDVVIATGAVRDDKASWDYIYKEYPALASMEYLIAIRRAIAANSPTLKSHFGIVHSKSSLYAREFHLSLMPENDQYMAVMQKAGVLASEMECAQLFTLSSIMSTNPERISEKSRDILCACILTIVGDRTSFSLEQERINAAISATISLSIETTQQLVQIDKNIKPAF